MKKIKLAVLAGALVLSAAGGYADYKMKLQYYYIVPNTPHDAESFQVALDEPSPSCGVTGFNRVCQVLAANGYNSGDFIHSSQCTITSTYP